MEDWEKIEPDWANMPSDEELIAARETLKKLSHAIAAPQWAEVPHGGSDELWSALVEAKCQLTVTIDWLSYWKPTYKELWKKILDMD